MLGWHLVKKLPQGLVALALVADLGGGDPASAGADVGRAVLLTRVVQVAGLGCVQAVVVLGKCRFTCAESRGQKGSVKVRVMRSSHA